VQFSAVDEYNFMSPLQFHHLFLLFPPRSSKTKAPETFTSGASVFIVEVATSSSTRLSGWPTGHN
jgi:hypothetical protein